MELLRISKKERILKAARGKKEVTYKGTPLGYQQDFSSEMLRDGRVTYIFRVLKDKNCQPRTLYPAVILHI